jgi:hypothetical protein
MGTEPDLPEEVSEVSLEALERGAKARDRRLTRLFRRWPALTRAELAERRQLYNQCMPLPKLHGSRCRRQRP